MSDARTVFLEELLSGDVVIVQASGAIDFSMLDALENFVKRQRVRLKPEKASHPEAFAAAMEILAEPIPQNIMSDDLEFPSFLKRDKE